MKKPVLKDKSMLTVIEACDLFGLSRRKMFDLVKNENVPFLAMFRSRKLIIKDELARYLATPERREELEIVKIGAEKRLEA